jgi:hypothetical protein
MSDNKSNVARLPPQQPAKFDIDFPALLTMSVEKGLDPQVIVTMFQNEIERRQREALDLVKADIYADMLPVLKDAQNIHLKNRYTTIPAMMEMLQPILKNYGVFVGFDVGVLEGEPPVADGFIRVRIVVSYRGYSDRSSYIDEPISRGGVRGGVTQMNEQQAITSATTYGARTLLKLKFNILSIEDDDDAEGARTAGNGRTPQDKPADKPQDDATAAQRGWRGKNVAQWAETLCQRLAGAQTLDGIDTLMTTPPVSEWLADQAGGPTAEERVKIGIARMDATKRIVNATPAPLAPDVVSGEPAPPSEAAQKLLAVIASCQTKVALDSLLTAPEFSRPVSALPIAEGDLVNDALKARYIAVGAA